MPRESSARFRKDRSEASMKAHSRTRGPQAGQLLPKVYRYFACAEWLLLYFRGVHRELVCRCPLLQYKVFSIVELDQTPGRLWTRLRHELQKLREGEFVVTLHTILRLRLRIQSRECSLPVPSSSGPTQDAESESRERE